MKKRITHKKSTWVTGLDKFENQESEIFCCMTCATIYDIDNKAIFEVSGLINQEQRHVLDNMGKGFGIKAVQGNNSWDAVTDVVCEDELESPYNICRSCVEQEWSKNRPVKVLMSEFTEEHVSLVPSSESVLTRELNRYVAEHESHIFTAIHDSELSQLGHVHPRLMGPLMNALCHLVQHYEPKKTSKRSLKSAILNHGVRKSTFTQILLSNPHYFY